MVTNKFTRNIVNWEVERIHINIHMNRFLNLPYYNTILNEHYRSFFTLYF